MADRETINQKHHVKFTFADTAGVIGSSIGYKTYGENTLRVILKDIGGSGVVTVEARLEDDTSYTSLGTVTGATTGTFEIGDWDHVRYNYTTNDGKGEIIASGFFKAGGGASGNSFETIQADFGTNPVATSSTDTLTLTSSDNTIIITGDDATDEIDLQVSTSALDALYLKLDGSNDPITGDLTLTDNTKLYFGTSDDTSIEWTGSILKFTALADEAQLSAQPTGNTDLSIATTKYVDTLTDDSMPSIFDTEVNILTSTPTENTCGYSTDTNELFIYHISDATWKEASTLFVSTNSSPDIGSELHSNKSGYGSDYISQKKLSYCSIAENGSEIEGGIRFITDSDGLKKLQIFRENEWIGVLIGLDTRTRSDQLPLDFVITTFSERLVSLVLGDSVEKDIHGLPLVQEMQAVIGAHQAPQIINGGTF